MSSPGGISHGGQWPAQPQQGPPPSSNNGGNEDGVSVRPMRLKVLYTFDDQNKTNCLARGEDVLQVKTVAMDETTSIGVLDLKTCIETVVRCSPELLGRVGQDYTVYAYDFSEYDNPLVGQGMLSRVLAAAAPNAPAHQSQKLITGRVCKNILGLFNNGVKETLEVKLRLVPVPTVVQNEYSNTMERYRETSNSAPPGFDQNEWTKFLQSNPNMTQMSNNFGAPASTASNHRGSMNMEVVNQLLSPSIQQQPQPPTQAPFNQAPSTTNQVPGADSGNETRGGTNASKAKKTSRPSSRAAVKRPRAKRQPKASANVGGNTSGYEEGTDGDDGPAPRKRAKITQTDWNSKSSLGTGSDSLRVAASTASSLRVFRPIAMSPALNTTDNTSHLQELPRAPTPVPSLSNQQSARDRNNTQSGLRHESHGSFPGHPVKHVSPYPVLNPPEDQLRDSIESANSSPERRYSPADTTVDIGSSPPVRRTTSRMPSSPPCPSSPVLPQMPREEIPADSGFMSGTIMDDLFGEDWDETIDPTWTEDPAPYQTRREELRQLKADEAQSAAALAPMPFTIEVETPGPMELLPTRMPVFEPFPQRKAASKPSRSRAGSATADDGQTVPSKDGRRNPPSRLSNSCHPDPEIQLSQSAITPSASLSQTTSQNSTPPQTVTQQPVTQAAVDRAPSVSSQPQPRKASRMIVRTASLGSLTLPTVPASDPVLPPSSLQRSQTWTEAPHPLTEAPTPPQTMEFVQPGPQILQPVQNNLGIAPRNSAALIAKKASMRQKLEAALANGEMPPYCSNCGAIETPTWRKAWSQEHTGEPGYYDYSDLPGRVTTIVVLTRDAENRPTLYQLVKKYLGPEEDTDKWNEFILCNPCGLWMSKYKAHRPPERWESNPNAKRRGSIPLPPGTKRPAQRQSRPKKSQPAGNEPTSDANFPMSDIYGPPSEACFPQPDAPGPGDSLCPQDFAGILQQDLQVQRMELPPDDRPPKRLNAMTSDAASAALRRAIQSSPARWTGTQHSPIDVEDELGSTRRLLFPSPRKDGSPKILGDLEDNIIQLSPKSGSSKERSQSAEASNKENCPPMVDVEDDDAELLALFEAEMARPSTPVQNEVEPSPFKTPTRPTTSHRPITRSVSKSIRSAKSPGQALMFPQRTPSKTPVRRSPRHHHNVFESPFTASLNQLMSEANNLSSPSRHCDMGIDFNNLPDLPLMDNTMHNSGYNGHYNNLDFFSTDIPMPSSPPKNFHLYEDPSLMADVDWNAFDQFDGQLQDAPREDSAEMHVKTEPTDNEIGEQPPTHPSEAQGVEQLIEEISTTSQQSPSTLAEQRSAPPKENPSMPTETPTEKVVAPPTQDDEDEDEVDMVLTSPCRN